MVTVRKAVIDDLEAIVFGARAFAIQANLEHLVAKDTNAMIMALLNYDKVHIFLAETGDAVIGGIGVAVAPWIWNHDLIEMGELFFWVHPGSPKTTALALLRHVLSVAKEEHVGLITFSSLPTSPPGIDKLYTHMGFRKLQETYIMETTSWQ